MKEKDSILVEKQQVERELARQLLHEQEEGAATATEAAGEEDEIKALRRRLTYWRLRDKARQEVHTSLSLTHSHTLTLSLTHTHTLSLSLTS